MKTLKVLENQATQVLNIQKIKMVMAKFHLMRINQTMVEIIDLIRQL